MITASVVTHHTNLKDINRLIDCATNSCIDHLFIIDNSTNDSLRNVVTNKDNIYITYIYSLNLGYGAGHNIAIQKALEENATYHIILNPDIYWHTPVIEELAQYIGTHPEVGLIMPKVLYPNGELQHLCKLLPTPFDLLIRRFLPKGWMKKRQARFELHASGYDQEMNVPYLSGCFMFIRVEALKQVGLFDERFFMYGEDIDLSRRIHNAYKTIYYPYVSIIHKHERASYKNYKMLFVHMCNIARYFKWEGYLILKDTRLINSHYMK